MNRQVCKIAAQNNQEALAALVILKKRIEAIPYTQSMNSVCESVEVINEGTSEE